MSPEEAKRLLAGEFGKQLLRAAGAYCLPLFWQAQNAQGSWRIMHNGTGFILDCGSGPFFVTAAHVYEGYLADQQNQKLRCWLSALPFPLERRLISCLGHGVLDVATFSVSDKEVAEIKSGGKAVLSGNQEHWPPALIRENEGVLFAGYPGHERIESDDLECNFGLYSALTPVSSVSERHFGCAFDRSEWIDTMGNGLPVEEFDLGGISGCPVLRLKESTAGIVSWSLAGVGYNSSAGIGEIFLAHHASVIGSDGFLKNEI